MLSTTVEVMRLLDAWPAVQQSLVAQLAAQIAQTRTLSESMRLADEECRAASLECASFFLPSPSPGHPPLPHQTEPSTSRLTPACLCTCDGETEKLHVRLALRLDVFCVLQLSPSLGELLMLQPYTGFQAAMEDGVVSWLTQAAVTVIADGDADEHASLIICAARDWAPHVLACFVQRRVSVQMRLLLLRVPHFYACITSLTSSPPPCSSSPAAVVACLSDIAGEHEDGVTRSLSVADFERELHELRAADSAASAVPAIGCPSDTFLESDTLVALVGVVQEVRYSGRTSMEPVPWLGFVVYPRPMSSSPSHGSLGPALCERKELDIHLLPGEVQQRVAVVGEVLRVEGRMAVGPVRMVSTAAIATREGTMLEYMEVHRVWSLRQPCAFFDTIMQAERQQPSCPQTSSPTQAIDNTDLCSTVIGANDTDSATEEQAAVLSSLRSWEGARLALGIRQTAGDVASTSLLAEKATVACTDVFALSLDTVVAELLTLLSAQLRPGLGGGVTLFVLDESGASHVKEALARLATVAPAAFMEVDPVCASRSHGAHYLPTYKLLRTTGTTPTPRRRAPGFDGTVVPAVTASQKSRPDDNPVAYAQRAVTEVLCGGLLSQAGQRALVLRHVELLPTDGLQTLQDALRAKDVKSYGSDLTAVINADSSVGLSPEELRAASAVGGACGGADARGGQLVVRRDGGQRVRYCVTQAALCAVGNATALLQRPALFEFAQRQDLVLRPSFDTRRRMMALYGTMTLPSFRLLLQLRGAVWMRRLANVFTSPCNDQPHLVNDAPRLTGGCGELLRVYFLAARAVCKDGVDASMMTTLVKLTCCHAVWRERVTRSAFTAFPLSSDTMTTRLVDAIVAIGLCDATLHFLTGKTLLGTCIFTMLQRELAPREEGGADTASSNAAAPATGADSATPICPDGGVEEVRALAREVEFMTRPPSARHGDGDTTDHVAAQATRGPVGTFSVFDLVHDLVHHLQHYISP